MGKAAFAAPVYISVAWTLMVSYQLFTQISVTTVVTQIDLLWPSFGSWLTSRIDMIVFIYAFSWVFVLSSVIPSVILGKERSVLMQFLVCLTLTFIAFVIQDALTTLRGYETIDQIFGLTSLFHNPYIAIVHLSTPYLFMLALDIRSRQKHKKIKKYEEKQKEGLLDNDDS